MAIKNDRWKPRKYMNKGELRYCSPACGGDCRMESYKEIKKITEAARRSMPNPSKWTVVISENLGWYGSIHNGYISVSCDQNDYWTLMTLNPKHVGTGDPELTPPTRHFRSARAAIKAQVEFAKAKFSMYRKAIAVCEKALDIA